MNRGAIGEAAVLKAFIVRGFPVLTPFGEGHPYDLVVDLSGSFARCQVKTAWPEGGCLLFNGYATDHGKGPGRYTGLIDLFAVYFPPLDSVYVVPVGEVPLAGRLRLEPTRNNQQRRIKWAHEYEIGTWSARRLAKYSCGAQAIAA